MKPFAVSVRRYFCQLHANWISHCIASVQLLPRSFVAVTVTYILGTAEKLSKHDMTQLLLLTRGPTVISSQDTFVYTGLFLHVALCFHGWEERGRIACIVGMLISVTTIVTQCLFALF
jgi:hypothetical protein